MTLKLGKNNYKNNYLFIGLLHNISQSHLCCCAIREIVSPITL